MPKLTKNIQKENADNLAGDLLQILKGVELDNVERDTLMQKLTIYISNRDNMIWQHAYNLGKAGQDSELEPGEEG